MEKVITCTWEEWLKLAGKHGGVEKVILTDDREFDQSIQREWKGVVFEMQAPARWHNPHRV